MSLTHVHLFLLLVFWSLLVVIDSLPHCVCWLNLVLVLRQSRSFLPYCFNFGMYTELRRLYIQGRMHTMSSSPNLLLKHPQSLNHLVLTLREEYLKKKKTSPL